MTLAEYIICNGKEKTIKKGDRLWFDRSEIVLCKSGVVGEYQGELLVDVYSRKEIILEVNTTGVALSEGCLYSIAKSKIPIEYKNSLHKNLIKRNTRLLDRIGHLTEGSVETRLYKLLANFGDRYGMFTGKTTFIPLSISRQKLAEMLNCRSETVTRIVSKWRKSGVVDFRKEGIELIRTPSNLSTVNQ